MKITWGSLPASTKGPRYSGCVVELTLALLSPASATLSVPPSAQAFPSPSLNAFPRTPPHPTSNLQLPRLTHRSLQKAFLTPKPDPTCSCGLLGYPTVRSIPQS